MHHHGRDFHGQAADELESVSSQVEIRRGQANRAEKGRESVIMPRIVKAGLIQATLCEPATSPTNKIKEAMIAKHVKLVEQAAAKGVQVVCFQELFYGPYFAAEQKAKWYELVEKIPDGKTTQLFMSLAKKHQMVIVLPMYEEDLTGVYYNTAAVIDADGSFLGKFRKTHIPHCD